MTGKYRIVHPLKTGGTAEVLLALMVGENRFVREVVIKRPLPHLLQNPRLRAMFVDEAHIASRLAHPNIVQVLDLVARDDDTYLVLEYLKGRDLREVERRSAELGRAIPRDIAVYIASEVAAALDYAHEATDAEGRPFRLVHRDVSPKNIRLTDAGAVKLIDFGIARADHRETETAPGAVKGTMGYMSPEQVLGHEVDRRTDIFALGVVLYTMLTGKNPFDGESLRARIAALIELPVPSLRAENRGVDEALEAIVMRCLERDPERRYPTARALEDALHRYSLGDSQDTPPRKRLVELLEDLFPDVHETHPVLRDALSTYSGLSEPGADEPLPSFAEVAAPPPQSDPGYAAVSAWASPPARSIRVPSGMAEPASGTTTGLSARQGPVLAVSAALFVFTVALVVWLVRPAVEVESLPAMGLDAQAIAAAPDAGGAVHGPAPPIPALPRDLHPASPGGADVAPAPTARGAERAELRAGVAASDGGASPGRAPTRRSPAEAHRAAEAPKELFSAGVRQLGAGELELARWLFLLAYDASGGNPDPALFKNLGVVAQREQRAARAADCFRRYLKAHPAAPDAPRISAWLAKAADPPEPCVAEPEVAAAKRRALRAGPQLEALLSP